MFMLGSLASWQASSALFLVLFASSFERVCLVLSGSEQGVLVALGLLMGLSDMCWPSF